jgi:hypothetical protein
VSLVRRRQRPLSRGEFRLRVFAASFALLFVLTLLVAAVHG